MSDAQVGAATGAPVTLSRADQAALLRFRVIAYIVGVGLVILVLIGVPVQVWGNSDSIVKIVGPLHGFLYVVYLLLTLDLARRVRMNPIVMILVMAAGTIPFLSFVAERKVTAMLTPRA